MAESINWHNEKRRIKELIPYVANPRQITDKQAKDLKASLAKQYGWIWYPDQQTQDAGGKRNGKE